MHSHAPWRRAERRDPEESFNDDASSQFVETHCMAAAALSHLALDSCNDVRLVCFADCQPVTAAGIKGRARRAATDDLLRLISLPLLVFNVALEIRWKPRTEAFQVVADRLSHCDPSLLQEGPCGTTPFTTPASLEFNREQLLRQLTTTSTAPSRSELRTNMRACMRRSPSGGPRSA